MGIYKNGIVTASAISESLVNPLDLNFYSEPDGTAWIRIFHHNNPANALFESTDTFTSSVYKDTDRWFNVALCNLADKWELMIKQATTSGGTEEKYRWIQSVNPMIAEYADVTSANVTKISNGYNVLDDTYGGIFKQANGNTYLSGTGSKASTWYGAIGSWTVWNNGIPGYNGNNRVITTGYIDLYLRVDNISPNKVSIYRNAILANEINEI